MLGISEIFSRYKFPVSAAGILRLKDIQLNCSHSHRKCFLHFEIRLGESYRHQSLGLQSTGAEDLYARAQGSRNGHLQTKSKSLQCPYRFWNPCSVYPSDIARFVSEDWGSGGGNSTSIILERPPITFLVRGNHTSSNAVSCTPDFLLWGRDNVQMQSNSSSPEGVISSGTSSMSRKSKALERLRCLGNPVPRIGIRAGCATEIEALLRSKFDVATLAYRTVTG